MWHTIVSPTGREKTGYPTQKPEALLRRFVQASSRPGDLCLDPFAGSGTLGAVAAEPGPALPADGLQPGGGHGSRPRGCDRSGITAGTLAHSDALVSQRTRPLRRRRAARRPGARRPRDVRAERQELAPTAAPRALLVAAAIASDQRGQADRDAQAATAEARPRSARGASRPPRAKRRPPRGASDPAGRGHGRPRRRRRTTQSAAHAHAGGDAAPRRAAPRAAPRRVVSKQRPTITAAAQAGKAPSSTPAPQPQRPRRARRARPRADRARRRRPRRPAPTATPPTSPSRQPPRTATATATTTTIGPRRRLACAHAAPAAST